MKKLLNKLLILLMIVSLIPINAKAGSVGSISIDGTNMNVGDTKELQVKVSANIQSADGTITSKDSTCVEVVSVTSQMGSGSYFAAVDMGGNALGTVATVKVKGLKNCQTKLLISNASVGSTNGSDEDRGQSFESGTIVVGSSTSTKSSDASLKSLTISKGSIDFNSNTTTYNVEVENDVDSISVDATANDSKATVTGTGNKSLSVGSNKIEVKVVAEDGTTSRTYTINITRKGSEGGSDTPVDDNRSSDNNLKILEVNGQTLNPEFSADNTSYSLEVDNNVTELGINAVPNNDKASVTVLGNSGLKVGVNNINVVVVAEDGSQKVYSIKVVRKGDNNETPSEVSSKSSENRLRNLFVANGVLTPNFNSDVTSYDIVIANNVNELDLTATPIDSKARVQIANNGDFVVGETKTVQVTVTAEDGSQRIYTINVKKSDKEANNKLTGITIDGTTLNPTFNPNTTVYTAQVGSGTKSINVKATPENENAKVEYSVNGSEFKSDGNLDLQEGNNVVIVKVTDENGFIQMYTVNVEKKSSTFELFGIKLPKWLGYLLLGLLLLLVLWLIFLVLKRRKKQEQMQATQAIPNIEIKPEFNFGSKNEDNDTVEDGGVLNQSSNGASSNTEDHDKEYGIEYDRPKEIPYDPYDEIVTKDEIIDAINEKDPEKLKMLYKQEMLNREKEKLKERSEAKVVDYEERKED